MAPTTAPTGPARRSRRPPTLRRPAARIAGALVLAAAVTGTAMAAGACAGDSEPVLTGEAARGQQVAKDRGCTSCHTATGGRSEGPTWKGLAGSTVTLADGRTVVADDMYLSRSITQPRAEVVQGYRIPMPTQNVSDADVTALVAYIKALR